MLRKSYLVHQKKLAHLAHIQALLEQDQETVMPAKAGEGRAEQIGYIAGLYYDLSVAPEYQEIISKLSAQQETLESWQQRSLMLAEKELRHTLALEKSFVEEFEKVKSRTQQFWAEARQKNDFQMFAPHLEQVIELTKQYARAVEPNKDPYDTLLDIYEEDATQERYDALLTPLQQPLTNLVKTVSAQEEKNDVFSPGLTKEETKALLQELCKTIGFDFDAGTFGEVHHPFMTTLGAYDYRINTRYNHPQEAITGMIHELGHGLYEQRNNPKRHYTNLHYGASTGMHESQSRTLENMVGRSAGMSTYVDLLSRRFGASYTGSSAQRYHALNHVQPSYIRIAADEVSYGLHILLRYEIEKLLIGGEMAVTDLPVVWNEKMKQYLGIVPPTDALGCLQDVHWSCGLFGYFPTYLLGNIYAGQLWDQFTQTHPEREQHVAQGDFSTYFARYKTHIWTLGRSVHPQELIKNVTGRPIDATYFLTYLQDKYTK